MNWGSSLPDFTESLALRLLGVSAPTYSIAGQVFVDHDKNGVLDEEDTPPNTVWTIQLDQGCDGTVDRTATVIGSVYSFDYLLAGQCYRVSEEPQTGWQQTTTLADIASLDRYVEELNIGNWYPRIYVAPEHLPAGVTGVYYEQQIGVHESSTGTGPYTFALIPNVPDGSPSVLPDGMALSLDGLLSGTSENDGQFLINVQATDSTGATGSTEYWFVIAGDPELTLTASPDPAAAGQELAFTLSASGNIATPDGDSIAPFGHAAFFADGTAIAGCENLSIEYDNESNGNVPAVCKTSSLAAGSHLVRADYAPDERLPYWHEASQLLFVAVGANAAVRGQDVASGENPSATSGMQTASATGSGALVVANYAANPGGTPTFKASGAYFDVYAAPGNTFTGVTIQACGLTGGKLFWWNAATSAWLLAQNQSYDSATGCITLQVNGSSSPTLSQMAGTYFATAITSTGYQSTGFTAPIDLGGVLNQAKAGQTVPLKWRLLDENSSPITNLDPASVGLTVSTLSCPAGTPVDAIETYATGTSTLQNLGDGYYQLNWKTDKAWVNACKQLTLKIGTWTGDGLTALFQFKK